MTPFLAEIRKHVVAHPNELALYGQGVEYTYSELWGLASSFAAELRDRGCKPDDIVATYIGNHPFHIVAFLAVLMAGGIFLPLDKPVPAAKKEEILRDSEARFVITTNDILGHARRPGNPKLTIRNENDAAYLVYTSGSTGPPKGVLIAYRGYLPMLIAQREAFRIGPGKRSLLTLAVGFDASLSDIGVALISGATLFVEERAITREPRRLLSAIRSYRITHLDLPPALLSVIVPTSMPGCVETVVFGGEPCPPETVRTWAKRFRMVNVYGPTETTICASLCQCTANKWTKPLIGRPLPHLCFEINNEAGTPVEAGEIGELHIGGPAVALEYLNNSVLTKERFYQKDGQPFYRTGDMVRLEPNGEVLFCGRNDEQVKIGGIRLQLEEVEARLRNHKDIKRASVVKKAGNLEAFIVCPKSTSEDELRTHLLDYLPSSLIPTAFHRLSELPETSTGKPDKSALMQLTKTTEAKLALRTELEERLCQIFASVLKRPVSGHDNFFSLGGNSIAAIEIVALAAKSNISIPPSWIEEEETIKAIAQRLQNEKPKPRAMTREELFNDATPSPTLQSLLVKKAPPVQDSPPLTIMLTGATGFLGSNVLDELLKKTKATIYCISRNQTIQSPDERVFTIRGDLSQPQLGLDDMSWQSLSRQVDTVFHCAASISDVATYERLRSVNVFGTEEILRFCLEGRSKKLHYASTLSVFVATDRKDRVFYEKDELSRKCQVFGGYGQSKYAAELLIRQVEPYIPLVTYHRFGLITGHSRTGQSKSNCFIKRLLQSDEDIPDDSTIRVDITPVDYAAGAMVHLSLAAKETETFHISAGSATAAQLKNAQQKDRRNTNDALTKLSLCRHRNYFAAFRDLELFQATDVTFDTCRCDEMLRDSGLIKPEITDELLKSYSLSSSSSK